MFVGKHFDLFQSRPNASTAWKVEYRSYVKVGDRLVAIRTEKKDTPSGPIVQTLMRYAHTDHLGSVVAMSDSLGAVIDRADFDSWGKRRPAGAPIDQLTTVSPAFTGHKQIEDLQLIHMGGRVYDPVIGVFLSADPFVPVPGSTQGWNPYTYVLNNPLSSTDPTGFAGLSLESTLKIAVMFGPEVALLSQFEFIRKAAVPLLRALGTLVSFTQFGYLAPAFYMAAAALQTAYEGGSTGDIFKSIVTAAAAYAVGYVVGSVLGKAISSVSASLGSTVSAFSGASAQGSADAAGAAAETATESVATDVLPMTLGAAAADNVLGNATSQSGDRKACVIAGGGCSFTVADNPNASGAAPWYEVPSESQVDLYDYGIESVATETGVDADLIRSVMYVETTHGWYEAPFRWAGINRTILPMNVYASYWSGLGFSRAQLQNPYYNIKAGALILRGIQANLGPGASIAQIGTLYKSLYAPAVTNYGARVAEVYRTRPW